MERYEALSRARRLRPNVYDDAVLIGFLEELEGRIAREILGEEPGAADAPLAAPPPFDALYPLYLAAMVDFHDRETDSYANDMALFNAALAEFRSWHRRRHRPRGGGRRWRI